MKVKNLVLSGEDLCRIIKECASSGVVEFTAGDLSICFDGLKRWRESEKVQGKAVIDPRPILEQEAMSKEAQLEQMLIEDPLQYERLLAQGELNEEN